MRIIADSFLEQWAACPDTLSMGGPVRSGNLTLSERAGKIKQIPRNVSIMESPRLTGFRREPSPRISPAGRTWLLITSVGALILAALHMWWIAVPTPLVRSGSQIVEIPSRQGLFRIAERLNEAGVIRSSTGFVLLAGLRGSAKSLKAGEYEIPQDATTVTILALLESGKVRPHSILFPEGATVRDLARLLEADRLVKAEEIFRLSRDRGFLQTLGIEADSLEGYLFPDTYSFTKGMAAEEILARMAHRLREQVTQEILAQAQARDLTLHQLLTLASIIEKEAVEPDEHPLISAVFWNRLKRRMPLQADPTVKYALGKDGRALTREDLRADSRFNTYRYPGLPPAPIASPGKGAIMAALNPAKVNYLYFVSMDERRHFFSSTLEQHNSAVARYRLARVR